MMRTTTKPAANEHSAGAGTARYSARFVAAGSCSPVSHSHQGNRSQLSAVVEPSAGSLSAGYSVARGGHPCDASHRAELKGSEHERECQLGPRVSGSYTPGLCR